MGSTVGARFRSFGLGAGFSTGMRLVLAYKLIIICWSIMVPFDGAPDEHRHSLWPEFTAEFHRLPVPDVDPSPPYAGRYTGFTYDTSTAWYIGLPFLHGLGAIITGEVFRPVLPTELGYLGLRAINWVFAVAYCAFLYATFRVFGLGERLSVFLTLPLILIPQVTFIFAYFNHDGYGLFAAAFIVYATARFVHATSFRRRDGCLLGVALGLLGLAKAYHWPIALFAAGWLAIYWLPRWREGIRAFFGTVLPVALLVAVPINLINYLHYGDFVGSAVNLRYAVLAPFETNVAKGVCFFGCGDQAVNWGQLIEFLIASLASFFGVFGWMGVFMPQMFYVAVFGPVLIIGGLVAVSGLTELFLTQRAPTMETGRGAPANARAVLGIGWFLLFVCVVGLSLWSSSHYGYQPQGRYLFAVVPALAPILALAAASGTSDGGSTAASLAARVTRFAFRGMLVFAVAGLSLAQVVAVFTVLPFAHPDHVGPLLGLQGAERMARTAALARGLVVAAPSVAEGREVSAGSIGGPLEAGMIGAVERVSRYDETEHSVQGWAADAAQGKPAGLVLIVVGDRIVAVVVPTAQRNDVLERFSLPASARRSGFAVRVPDTLLGRDPPCDVRAFAVAANGGIGELAADRDGCKMP